MRIERARLVPWRKPIVAGDGRGAWRERRGWLLVLESEGLRGIGEASPLPGFAVGADDVAAAGAELARLGAQVTAGGERVTVEGGQSDTDGWRLTVDGRPLAVTSPAARFAIETAALDLVARQRGVPLAAVLTPAPAARVAVNAVVGDPGAAAAAVGRGLTTLKVKVGAELAAARATLVAIAAAAPGARLRIDANQTWPLAAVDTWLDRLADLALEYVEEPAAGLAATLRAPRALPLALDESLAAPDREAWLERALASGAVAALVLKPTVLGGLAACRDLAARALAHGVDAVVTHALDGPVATAAAAELARALAPRRAVGLDRHPGLAPWSVAVPQLADAVVAAPGPGLGLDVDAVLAAAEVDDR